MCYTHFLLTVKKMVRQGIKLVQQEMSSDNEIILHATSGTRAIGSSDHNRISMFGGLVKD
jgi:hypothetical protein